MSYKLEKPYTDKQRADFIVEYNHQQGLNIQETDTALYALEAWEKLEGDTVIDNSEEYQQEQAQKEAERIAMLNLTRGDVFRGLLLAKGITRAQIKSLIDATPATTQEEIIAKEMAYIDFEEATNYYRGNSLIDTIAGALGITSKQLDRFFEAGMSEDVNIKSNAYKYLTTVTFTVNPTPIDCKVLINGLEQDTVTVPYGDTVEYSVAAEGYLTQSGTVELTEDTTLEVELVEEVTEENISNDEEVTKSLLKKKGD